MTTPQHIGIVIPAHNEADDITACLTAINHAIDYATSQLAEDIIAEVLVVLDSCDDNTEALVNAMNIASVQCNYRCVGQVRDLGIRQLIANGADWIACTDADSRVSVNWLTCQIAHIRDESTDMICGVVEIDNWQHLSAATREQYIDHYQDKMGHQHIHGANLAFSAQAYLNVGGFKPLPCHEDVQLVKTFEAAGLSIVWSNQVRVMTSSRLDAKAEGGFGSFLVNLENQNAP